MPVSDSTLSMIVCEKNYANFHDITSPSLSMERNEQEGLQMLDDGVQAGRCC